MAIVNDMFGSAGFIAIPSLNLQINQLPYVGIGAFGLFLYLMYAGKVNREIGEKRERLHWTVHIVWIFDGYIL